jgi:protein-tyrosine phosphatase
MADRQNQHELSPDPLTDRLSAAAETNPGTTGQPAPEIKNPEIELHHPEIPEVIATTKDAREPSLRKHFLHLTQQLRKQGLLITLIEGFDQGIRLLTGAPTRRFSQLSHDLSLGGQYDRRGLLRLRERGVTSVVNMRGEYDEQKHGFAPEYYCHLPTVDNHAPTLEHLRKGVGFIQQEVDAGRKVYIHCWEGVGRAPTMLAAYLVSTGIKPGEAWARIKAVRPFIRPSLSQISQVDLFAAECGDEDKRPISERLPRSRRESSSVEQIS